MSQDLENSKRVFNDLWVKTIDKNVNMSNLNRCVEELIKQGLSMDYLIFTLKYVIKNKFKLNYPSGLKYYVEYEEIKKAYEKKNRKFIKMSDFTAVDTDDYPRYTYHAKKSMGFADIFGDGGG